MTENTRSYKEFLQGKIVERIDSGFDISTDEINPKLFPFQKEIVRWALMKGNAAIFAACGLGKTPMQLEWAYQVHRKTGKDVLILAPLAVTSQTKREGQKFGIEVNICRSQFDIQPGINITNYEMLDNFQPQRFGAVVLDESSILKNSTGRMRTRLIELFNQTPYRLCCTATPAPNDHMELGNHVEFLGLMTGREMLSKYFINDGSQTNVWRLKRHAVKPFWAWVSSWAVCLNKPSDIGFNNDGFDLPPLNWQEVVVRADITDFAQGRLFKNQATSATNLYRGLKETIGERAKAIVDIIGNSKDYWLVWCNTNHEADVLKKALPHAIEVRGSESLQEKERKLSAFAEGREQILISKPSIAGFGLNLQHCHNMAFVGINYSFEQSYQAIRRCWRFQQQHAVNVYAVLAETETGVLDSVKEKARKHQEMEDNMINLTTFDFRKREVSMTDSGNVYRGNNWEMIEGDAVQLIKKIADDSIDFSIFSPPFSSIFVYSNFVEDMGNSTDDEQFFEHFGYLVPELYRVIKPGRLCAVHCSILPSFKFKDGQIGLKDFRGDIIRLFQKHDWIFHSEVCIWKCPVVEMTRTKALGLLHKQIKKDSSMCRTGIPDHIVVFRKPGENKEPITHNNENFPVDDWQKIASPVWMDIRQTNVLNTKFSRSEKDERHICPLQLDVIERCLRLWSTPGDLILSPFAGIGSEGYQSLNMDRRFLGFELKPEYVKVACDNLRLAESQKTLF